MNNIETIMKYPIERIIPLILEELKSYQISRIRHKLEPHWADGMYGKWSHHDPLFDIVFEDGGKKWVDYRDSCDDWTGENLDHYRCKLCGELLINSEGFVDSRYYHLFAACPEVIKIMGESENEQEFRRTICSKLKYIIPITT